MRPARAWILAALAAVLLCCGAARADSTLYIGTGIGTSCHAGCAGTPNQINGSSFDIYQVFQSCQWVPCPFALTDLFLVLAVPNNSTALNIIVNGSTGNFLGVYNGTPVSWPGNPTDLYGFLISKLYTPGECAAVSCGMAAQLSDTLANLESADWTIDGISASDYGIYIFDVGGGPPGSTTEINGVNIPLGTFAFGFGIENSGGGDGTPFAQAGITTPEPGSLILLGAGLLSMAWTLRRRFVNS